jgi:hypothetical protein
MNVPDLVASTTKFPPRVKADLFIECSNGNAA